MICQRGVRFPAPTAPGLKMRPMQRPAARGRGFLPRSRPSTADRSLIRSSGAAHLAVAARRLCGGQIPATLPVGRSVSRRRATTRSHPLADPLLPSGGADPPRQLRPALVCLRRDPLLLCEANRPAFGSLCRGSADPPRQVWLTTRCAGNPLAAAGPTRSGHMASLHLRSAEPPRLSASPR